MNSVLAAEMSEIVYEDLNQIKNEDHIQNNKKIIYGPFTVYWERCLIVKKY